LKAQRGLQGSMEDAARIYAIKSKIVVIGPIADESN